MGFLLALTPAANSVNAQAVSRFVVEGNQRIADETIRQIAGLPAGNVSAGQINRAVQNLFESGLFEDVNVTRRGGTVVVEVKEFPTISRIA
ncbi:MAG: POTRA domain-containing protein, partial [Pseudomonadota bacterium]